MALYIKSVSRFYYENLIFQNFDVAFLILMCVYYVKPTNRFSPISLKLCRLLVHGLEVPIWLWGYPIAKLLSFCFVSLSKFLAHMSQMFWGSL